MGHNEAHFLILIDPGMLFIYVGSCEHAQVLLTPLKHNFYIAKLGFTGEF